MDLRKEKRKTNSVASRLLLLHILDQVHDAKSLARCFAVSRRFSTLVPLTPIVSLSFAHRHLLLDSSSSANVGATAGASSFVSSICSSVGPSACSTVSLVQTGLVPCRRRRPRTKCKLSVLRWTAQFGGEMKSCVILGANSLRRRDGAAPTTASGEAGALESRARAVGEVELEPGAVIAEEELKLRVVWIIFCLIAASARHYLLKQIVAEHPKLKSVAIVDSNKQGKVKIREEEIAEMRRSNPEAEDTAEPEAAERIRVPDLRMKLWYAPELELPESGYVMRGATMVLIAPASEVEGEQGKTKEGGYLSEVMEGVSLDGGEGGEEKALREAAAEMRKMKKAYMLEMNSF